MKRRVIFIALLFIVVIFIAAAVFIGRINSTSNKDIFRKQLVELNELYNIVNSFAQESNPDEIDKLREAISECQMTMREALNSNDANSIKQFILIICIVCIVFVISIFTYVYFSILYPFEKMKDFAKEIARGNFDIPLNYERSNYFGAFTWAFDNMRNEVITARNNEKEAVMKNKTIIATISHDIKTPITSIRAYSESLASNNGQNEEKQARYISVILRKCDEVTNLTNDLLLHSISDLNKLKIELSPYNIKQMLIEALEDHNSDQYHVNLNKNLPDSFVMLDQQRFNQVIENLISNSFKYAGTDINVTCKIDCNDYLITIRDYGSGIPDHNMPFIFGKFYRGDNSGDKPGSGLGLYITEYIMKKHGGSIKLFNHSNGLEAVLKFPIEKNINPDTVSK